MQTHLENWWGSGLKLPKGRTQCTRLPLYAGSGRGECRLALPPFYGEAAPKSRTGDLPLMGEGTCHRTKCDLFWIKITYDQKIKMHKTELT